MLYVKSIFPQLVILLSLLQASWFCATSSHPFHQGLYFNRKMFYFVFVVLSPPSKICLYVLSASFIVNPLWLVLFSTVYSTILSDLKSGTRNLLNSNRDFSIGHLAQGASALRLFCWSSLNYFYGVVHTGHRVLWWSSFCLVILRETHISLEFTSVLNC